MANLVAGSLPQLRQHLTNYNDLVETFKSGSAIVGKNNAGQSITIAESLKNLAEELKKTELNFFNSILGWNCKSASEGLAKIIKKAEDFNQNIGTLAMVNSNISGFNQLIDGILNTSKTENYNYDINNFITLQVRNELDGTGVLEETLGKTFLGIVKNAFSDSVTKTRDFTKRNFDIGSNGENLQDGLYGYTDAGQMLLTWMDEAKKQVTSQMKANGSYSKEIEQSMRDIKIAGQGRLTQSIWKKFSGKNNQELQQILDEVYPFSKHLGWVVENITTDNDKVQIKLNGYLPSNSTEMKLFERMGLSFANNKSTSDISAEKALTPHERLKARLKTMILSGANGGAIWSFVEAELNKDKTSYAWSDNDIQTLKGYLGEVRATAMLNYAIHDGIYNNNAATFAMPAGTLKGSSGVYNNKQIPTDIFIKGIGFQVKNYNIGNNNIYEFKDENTIPYVLEHKMNMPISIQEIVKTFFADYSFNQKASNADSSFNEVASKFEPYKKNFEHIGKAFIPQLMSIDKTYSMNVSDNPILKQLGFDKEQVRYNTFFIINKYIISASSMVSALAKSLNTDAFKFSFSVQTTKEMAEALQKSLETLTNKSNKEDFNPDSKKITEKTNLLAKVNPAIMTYEIWKKSGEELPPTIDSILLYSKLGYNVKVQLNHFIQNAIQEGSKLT